jgi:hypothetical protein
MGILDKVSEIVSHQAATKASAIKVYQGLVRRAAENKNKKSDTLESIKDILSSAGKSPGEFKRDVDALKERKVLELLAKSIDQRQSELKAATVTIRQLEDERDIALAKIKSEAQVKIVIVRKQRHEAHQLLLEATTARDELRSSAKEAVTA